MTSSNLMCAHLVWGSETTLLDHLILVLDEELDSLNGGSGSLGDGSGDTTHEEVGGEATERLGSGLCGVSCYEMSVRGGGQLDGAGEETGHFLRCDSPTVPILTTVRCHKKK